MASADGSILIRTKVDTNGIKTGTNAIQSGVGKINNSLLKLGGTIAAVFSVYKLIEFGKQAVSLASDLQEVQNVVDVAFGDMSYKIEQFADSAIENFGLSELSAKTMASTFMAMANGMKQGLDVASDMTVEMTGRLADIMSFYNKSISEVETIGRAVYSGETEPLKAIGVIMTEAQLQTFALAHGYQQLYKDMSAADKLFVRQQYFLETTNQAAGDFVRTQDSWANQTRILSERWKEFLTLIGGRLIQVLTPAVNILNNLLTAAINLGNAMANVFGWQVQQSTAAGTTAGYVEDTASSQEDVADATNDTNKALKKQLAYFDDINVLSSQSASGAVTSTGGATGGGVGGGVVNTEKITQELTALEKKMLDFLNRIKKAWKTDADFTFLGEEFGKAINNMLEQIDWNVIKKNAYKLGKSIATFLNGSIKETDWNLVGKTLAESLNTVIEFAQGSIENFDFKEFGKAIGDGINGFFETADFVQMFDNASDLVIGLMEAISAALDETDFVLIGEKIADGLEAVDWNTIFATLGTLISEAIGGGIDILAGIQKSAEKSDAGKGEIEKMIPDTLWEWLQIGFATIGLDIEVEVNNKQKVDDLNEAIKNADTSAQGATQSTVNLQSAIDGVNPWVEVGVKYDENGWNTTLTKLGTDIAAWWDDVVVVWWDTKIVSFWDEKVAPWFTIEKWQELGQGMVDGISAKWDEFLVWWESTGIPTWFDESVAPWFTVEKWQEIGKNMQDGIKAGFNGIVGWIVGVLNGIIDGFEAMVNFVVEGANSIVDKFNSLPSAVRLGYTASRFDKVNFGNIPIPELAQGAVIPANKEFMAILGDQKSGVNIETPLQTMIDAFNTALNNRGGNNSGTVINLNVDGQTFARLTLDSFMNEMTRQGYDVAVLGG